MKLINTYSSTIHNNQHWKQFKYLLTNYWITKIWYKHTMEYYVAIKINKVLIQAMAWVNLKTLCYVKEANHKNTYV